MFAICTNPFVFFLDPLDIPCFFFFQAEDGIRDVAVTGVQTCALPISARRRAAWGGARLPCRRRVVVELGPGDCAWSQPAHRAAGARFACGNRQGAAVRSRASASLDDPARAGIQDRKSTRLNSSHGYISYAV